MVLTFTCNNCQALLTKSKIIRHYCLNPVINTTNEANNVVDNQSNGSAVSNKHFALVTMGLNYQEWNDFVATSLIKHETDDENLRLVLSGLRYRKNFPRKEKKFYNYINAFLPSKNVPDCAKIIWDIVTNKLKEYSANTSSVTVQETEKILQKRKLDIDNSTIESNSDLPEEKKTKLSDNIILPGAEPSEIEQTEPSNEMDVLEQNTSNISENNGLSNPENSEIEKLAADNSENPLPNIIQHNVPAVAVEKAVLINEKGSNRNVVWKEKVIERLSNYETQDENMKSVINTLKYKKYLPQKEDKFIKLLATIPKSRKIGNCCKIIWGVISGQESQKMELVEMMPELCAVEISDPQLDSDLLKINGNLESLDSKNGNVTIVSENKVETKLLTVEPVSHDKELPKPINVEPTSQPSNLINNEILEKRATKFRHLLTTEEWHVKVMEALNKYQTSDTDLLILIARLKNRNNIPQKFFKFKNFIHNMPLSHKIANCADLLWDIILPGNPDTSKNRLEGLSSGMPILTSVESIKHD